MPRPTAKAKAAPELTKYSEKRDFSKTAEPDGKAAKSAPRKDKAVLAYVIQKHWASRLHYDFRLELDGVLLSWAVPKGPSYDRPVSLVRAPTGITGELFFQKHLESKMPGLAELNPSLWPGHPALLAVDSRDALLAAAQMNTVEFHTWNSTTQSINKPNRMIFDLDPGDGVTWAPVREAALLMRAMLVELGLQSWVKTSGGKGLHVVVPLAPRLDYEVVKGFSQAVVQHMSRTIPQRFVSKSGGTNRVGKIFIDYLRNGHAQTTAAAFTARARPGLGVSMPISWDELPGLKSGALVDHRHRTRVPLIPERRPLGRLLENEANANGPNEKAWLCADEQNLGRGTAPPRHGH